MQSMRKQRVQLTGWRAAGAAAGIWLLAAVQACATEPTVERDPFWPLGFVPAASPPRSNATNAPSHQIASVLEIGAQDWADAEEALGIWPKRYSVASSEVGSNVVLLAGRFYVQGALVFHERNGVRFSWQVVRIDQGIATFERRRAELLERPTGASGQRR